MFSRYLRIAACMLIIVGAGSCRSSRKALSDMASITPSSDSYCQPAAEKALLCRVRDVAPRFGSSLKSVKDSEFAKISEIGVHIFSGETSKEPAVELRKSEGEAPLLVFERASDLYLRNGCLSEVTGAVFFDGFTPRVTLKLLVNTANSDHAAVAEISDFRHSSPLHLSLDLQCERTKVLR